MLEIAQRVDQALPVAGGGKIREPELIDLQVSFCRPLEIGRLPGVGRLAGLDDTGEGAGSARGERFEIRIGGRRNAGIDILVQYLLRVVIRQLKGIIDQVLIGVLGARRESIDLYPPEITVRRLVHLVSRLLRPVVKIADHDDLVFHRGIQDQQDGRIPGQVVDPFLGSCRYRGNNRGPARQRN